MDQSTLRGLLRNIDESAPSIQKTAAAMVKLYAQAPVAVTEWRNALQNAASHHHSRDQLLPLLYVANETIQTSKRNRGNKFLEAYSPILG